MSVTLPFDSVWVRIGNAPVLSLKNPKHIQNIPKNLKQRILIVYDAHQNYQNKKGKRAIFVFNLTLEIKTPAQNSRPNHQLCKVDLWCPMFIHVLAPSKRIKLQQLQPPRLNCGSSKEIWATWTPARLSTSTSNSSETPPRCPRGTWKLHPWGWLDFFHPPKRNECPKKGCHFKKVKACISNHYSFQGSNVKYVVIDVPGKYRAIA